MSTWRQDIRSTTILARMRLRSGWTTDKAFTLIEVVGSVTIYLYLLLILVDTCVSSYIFLLDFYDNML